MKKFIILIASAFSFCLFTTLLIFAFGTNDYGINVDESGLFPSFDFTFFDNESDQTFDNHMWADFSANTSSIKIHNNTKEDITLNSDIQYYPSIGGAFDINLNTYGPISITKDGTTFNIDSLPYTDYDYIYADYDLFNNSYSRNITLYGNEYYNNENDNADTKNSTLEHTIKAGETYEIKLS